MSENNTKTSIKFGTDGWRGIIAWDFTFENVRKVSTAIYKTLYSLFQNKPLKIVVGYDTRFNSERFANVASNTLSNLGCSVILTDRFLPTPALSSAVVDNKADAGIMITASHNPPQFNGYKLKTFNGAPASEEITSKIEENLKNSSNQQNTEKGEIIIKEITKDYKKRLISFVDMKIIKRSSLKIVVDPMYGSGIGYLQDLLKSSSCKIIPIHSYRDPLFGGMHPEPIKQNLIDLERSVKINNADIGLATDGDADRVGVVNEKGLYISPHQVFPLILYYLCKYKALRGKVVQAISLGYLSERISKDFNLEWQEVPVGFKNIAKHIINENILIGGEESGGYGYSGYLPERDGILNSLLIIEILSATKKTLSELIREIESIYGASVFLRADFPNIFYKKISKEIFVKKIKEKAPQKIIGLNIKDIRDYDGIKFILKDDSWVLLRPSGTEPIIRVYAESEDINKTKRLINFGKAIINSLQI